MCVCVCVRVDVVQIIATLYFFKWSHAVIPAAQCVYCFWNNCDNVLFWMVPTRFVCGATVCRFLLFPRCVFWCCFYIGVNVVFGMVSTCFFFNGAGCKRIFLVISTMCVNVLMLTKLLQHRIVSNGPQLSPPRCNRSQKYDFCNIDNMYIDIVQIIAPMLWFGWPRVSPRGCCPLDFGFFWWGAE